MLWLKIKKNLNDKYLESTIILNILFKLILSEYNEIERKIKGTKPINQNI